MELVRPTVQRRVTINGSVTIGNGCIIAPNVFISSGTHPFREYPGKPIREQERIIIAEHGNLAPLDRPITIGDDCWLGVNALVSSGVRIGDGCVIGGRSGYTYQLSVGFWRKCLVVLSVILVFCNYYYLYFVDFDQGESFGGNYYSLLKGIGLVLFVFAFFNFKLGRRFYVEGLFLVLFLVFSAFVFL